jgi:glycosyltransferase involved in cell wall biosynthesis
MRIAVIIPTRGNREKFLSRCIKRIMQQTRKPDIIEIVSDEPLGSEKDITWRYKLGISRAIKRGADVVFFIEDDDFYSLSYIETMIRMWVAAGRPKIFSLNRTVYYNIKTRSYIIYDHPGRGSMFMTMARTDAFNGFTWNPNNDPFTDLHIWKNIKGVSADVPRGTWLAIGIKHGIGLVGGGGHVAEQMRGSVSDSGFDWLRTQVGEEQIEFYNRILQQ